VIIAAHQLNVIRPVLTATVNGSGNRAWKIALEKLVAFAKCAGKDLLSSTVINAGSLKALVV
jgi:hypothetical protein